MISSRAGVALLLTILVVLSGACATQDTGEVVFADSTGALAVALTEQPYRLDAPAGTFPAGHRVEVRPVDALPDAGAGRSTGVPIEFVSDVQPVHPVTVQTLVPIDGDVDATTATVWDPTTMRPEALLVEMLPNGHLRVEVPHFSGFGFFSFPNPIDLSEWIIEGAIGFLEDFINTPYECSTPQFGSTLLDSTGYPTSVHLQVDVEDKDVARSTVTMNICNRLRSVLAYETEGGGEVDGFALPRSELGHDVRLQGASGDPFVLTARFNAEAVTATVALLVLDALPGGTAYTTKLIQKGLANSGSITLITNSARSCASAIEAALAAPDVTRWDGAVSCLKNLDSFQDAVLQLAAEAAVELGLDGAASAARLGGPLDLIIAGQVINRIAAEWLLFEPPSVVTFPYRLRCTSGEPCSPRTGAAPPTMPDPENTTYSLTCAGEADQPFTVQVRDGRGTADVPGSSSSFDISIEASAAGDLTGDGSAETAVLIYCAPRPSNFFVSEVVVIAGNSAPLPRLPTIDPADGGYPIPVYDPDEFLIRDATLTTGIDDYAPNESHADMPSLHFVYEWEWNGQDFVPRQVGGPQAPAEGLVLDAAGLGAVAFGEDMVDVEQTLSTILGEPDDDSGFVDMICESSGESGRELVWGPLVVAFEGPRDQATFKAYQYGGFNRDRQLAAGDPLGLRTSAGIGLGSTGHDILAAYGAAAVFSEGSPGGFPPPTWYWSPSETEYLFMTMDGNSPSSAVIAFGGTCGE